MLKRGVKKFHGNVLTMITCYLGGYPGMVRREKRQFENVHWSIYTSVYASACIISSKGRDRTWHEHVDLGDTQYAPF